jgi:hypothetical protein
MGYRSKIVELAQYWADPGAWKPGASDLIDFFYYAGAEAWPTTNDAEYALQYRDTGVKVGGQVKHWCGIFACYVIRQAGLSAVRWTLYGGKMLNIEYRNGNKNMAPGDVAIIVSGNHHFIVTDIDYSSNSMSTVEGNTSGQYIRARTRKTSEPYGYYHISE